MNALGLNLLTIFATLASLAQSFVAIPPFFGPDTPVAIFQGQITENGRPFPAHLSLEILYKLNGEETPLSLVQTNTIGNYDLRLNGMLLKNENFTNTAFLRAQALSVNGGSKLIQLELEDGKLAYEQDIELGHKHPIQRKRRSYQNVY